MPAIRATQFSGALVCPVVAGPPCRCTKPEDLDALADVGPEPLGDAITPRLLCLARIAASRRRRKLCWCSAPVDSTATPLIGPRFVVAVLL